MNRNLALVGALIAAPSVLILSASTAVAGNQGGALVRLQSSTPGVPQAGHLNISGTLRGSNMQASEGVAVLGATSSFGLIHSDGSRTFGTYVDPSGVYVGSVNTDSLHLYSAQAQATLTSQGYFGIGTQYPATPLHIVSPLGLTLGVDTNWGGYTGLLVQLSQVSDGYAWLQALKSSGSSWGDLVFNPYGGRVGVGTDVPIARLHSVGDAGSPIGVQGEGADFGVVGSSESVDGIGVDGRSTNLTGVRGNGAVNGIHGISVQGTAGRFIGRSGLFVQNTVGTGLYMAPTNAVYGIYVSSGAETGVHSWSDGTGLYGLGGNYGVYGSSYANFPNSWAVYANGRLGATGTKNFRIDHPLDPLNKYLLHYSAEGPEPRNVYQGAVVTDEKGYAWVELPSYYQDINVDPLYQLTVIDSSDDFVQVKVVEEIQGNRFRIRTNSPSIKVCWRVDAVRNDAFVQKYGAPVEVKKPEREAGKYQIPELYGAPPEMGLDHHVPPPEEQGKESRISRRNP